ncbi:diguanylate cyclase domain-containing protein [Desertibaculum subflavum]|uniref:diguanylate cyclase domain-containing protein n=1 Tax=Desertibaculum subflavum TaxID=2268458 RepID=UPI000E65ED24
MRSTTRPTSKKKPLLTRGFLAPLLAAAVALSGLAVFLRLLRPDLALLNDPIVVGGAATALLLAAAAAFVLARPAPGDRQALDDALARAETSEAALAHAADLVTHVLDAVEAPVFIKDRDRRFVLVNKAFCDYVGRPREELRGQRRDDLFLADGAAPGQEIVTGRDGTQHAVLAENAIFAGDDVVVGLVTDITDRRRGEDALQLAASVFEHSAEGIMVTDAANRIVRVNRAFCEISGYTAEELIGRGPSMLASGQHGPDFYGALWRRLAEEGHWEGEVINRRKGGAAAAEWLSISAVGDDRGRAHRYVAIYGEITERKAGEVRTRYLAQHDVLTGLVNRNLLGDRLNGAVLQAQRGGRRVALLTIDLDRFRPINDRLGHLAGDHLLRAVGRRLVGAVRRIDTVARLGGDRFGIVLLGIHGAADAALVADRLIGRLEAPFELDGQAVQLSASVGITLDDESGNDVEALLAASEAAMRRAKQAGGMVYAFSAAKSPALAEAPAA